MGLEALLGVPVGRKGGIREMRIKDVNEVGNILVVGGGGGWDHLRHTDQCWTSLNLSIVIGGIKS